MLDYNDISKLPTAALAARGIDADIAAQYGVRVEYDQSTGEEAKYYFPLYKNGMLSGYQVRTLPKTIRRIGDSKDTLPFGANIAGNGGKFLIVTEGAEDALAAIQLLREKGKQYRVVAALGIDGWARNLEYYSKFEKVVICFDQDGAGIKAAGEFALALPSGTGVIMRWDGDEKDPNDLLRAGKADKFLNALFRAEPYKPDCILYGEDVWRRIENYSEPEYIPYPAEWVEMNRKAKGMRRGEISLWCAGTSVGKTSYIRRLKQHVLTNTDWKIGEVELEEAPEKTFRGLMQFHGKKRMADMTPEEKRKVYEETYGTGRIFTLDHRAQYGRGESMMSKFNYLHYSLGVDIIFLDHITLAVSEFGEGNGLVEQDRMMAEFLEFVEKTQCHLCIISHLRKSPSGKKGFEEGAVPSEDDLKGSGSLKQISFDIIGVSRNKQHPNEYERNVSQLHILKCRETGNTGMADRLYWDSESMSLVEAVEAPAEDGDPDF